MNQWKSACFCKYANRTLSGLSLGTGLCGCRHSRQAWSSDCRYEHAQRIWCSACQKIFWQRVAKRSSGSGCYRNIVTEYRQYRYHRSERFFNAQRELIQKIRGYSSALIVLGGSGFTIFPKKSWMRWTRIMELSARANDWRFCWMPWKIRKMPLKSRCDYGHHTNRFLCPGTGAFIEILIKIIPFEFYLKNVACWTCKPSGMQFKLYLLHVSHIEAPRSAW